MNLRSFSILLLVMALMVPTLGAIITYKVMEQPEDEIEGTPDTGPLTQQFSTLTHAKLSILEESTLIEIEDELTKDLGLWVSSSRITLEDYRVTVLRSSVKADQVDLQVKIPVAPANLEGELGELITNSLMYGSMGSLPLLPGIRTDVSIDLLIEPIGEDISFEETITFSTEVVDPERGLLKLIQLLEADMNGWGSGMARDMEYMLNTLARYRSTIRELGTKNRQSSLEILNEGDIELAFNIALALRMTRWTGQVPQDLVETIDRFFKDQSPETEMNPTGYRFWGETEKKMFTSFYLKNSGTSTKRAVGDIIESAVEVGHADSADILSRYLMIDGQGTADVDVLDMDSLLEEEEILDPREKSNLVDGIAIEHHPSYPDSDGILVLPRDDYLPNEENEPPTLIPKLDPIRDYMVLGRDISIDGFEETSEWFTNANWSKPLSELEIRGGITNTTAPPESRCGNIPPPPYPTDHDFRLEWEFTIEGLFDVEASYEGFGGNAPLDKTSIIRSVKFDFPVRVHTWFLERPVNDMAYDFININTGKLYWSDIIAGWYITPVANATEFFEDQIYPYLKPGLSTLSQLLRTMEWYLSVPVLDNGAVRKQANDLAMSTMQQLDSWTRTNTLGKNYANYGGATKIWYEKYIETKDLQPEDLKTIKVEGHHLTFSYSPLKDILYITSDLVDPDTETAAIRLAIHGIKTEVYWVEGKITTDDMTIDISPSKNEYSINSNIEGYYFNDGPAFTNPPPQAVSSILAEGGWSITSPSIEIARWDVPSPFVVTAEQSKEENMTLSFIISGKITTDPLEILDLLQSSVQLPMKVGESQISLTLSRISSIAIENDLWFGMRTTSTGGDGSHELSRTFLLNVGENLLSSHSEIKTITWQSLSSSGRLNCLVRDMIWGAAVDTTFQVNSPVHTILIEEVPAWTSSTSMIEDRDMMYITHTTSQFGAAGFENLQSMNVASSGSNDINRYHYRATGWEISSYKDISILW